MRQISDFTKNRGGVKVGTIPHAGDIEDMIKKVPITIIIGTNKWDFI